MRTVFSNIAHLFKHKAIFRVCVLYLAIVFIVTLLLPWLPLPYQPNELDLEHLFTSPFSRENGGTDTAVHWLGTDGIGRDVLVNLLFGARSAFLISIPVMVITSLLGLLLGAYAGYYGDNRARLSRSKMLICILWLCCWLYFCLYLPVNLGAALTLKKALSCIVCLLVLTVLLWKLLLPLLNQAPFLKHKVYFPLDKAILHLIELFSSVPRFILIILVASFLPPSLFYLSVLLILTSWTSTARLARAEMLRVRHLPFFEAAHSLGVSDRRLIMKHALPNILAPVVVAFIFGTAGLMALESTLSFLGIGMPANIASWGRIITGIRSNTAAWWLVFFPGMFLTITVLALHTCSNYLLEINGRYTKG
ncbi:ABC transporter permease [Pontibacter sp. SGAir0037]|uniref:ABC transporter permease n=1 Tax=Pontibacter sp. SGAir0037 TaxID=2571030 RepID=UPI0010CD02E5|nr:ABC transporter permease [Pontibacter sp. SGAir0037]QCR21703.1 ABC transporter permease [Pontibacter sp. SGAir0037]